MKNGNLLNIINLYLKYYFIYICIKFALFHFLLSLGIALEYYTYLYIMDADGSITLLRPSFCFGQNFRWYANDSNIRHWQIRMHSILSDDGQPAVFLTPGSLLFHL